MTKELKDFIETGLWCSTYFVDGEPLDSIYSLEDVPTDILKEAQKFIDEFMRRAGPHFTEEEMLNSPIGHDLFLTVERHGAGFWDGDYKYGDQITEIVRGMGYHDNYWSEKLNEGLSINKDKGQGAET